MLYVECGPGIFDEVDDEPVAEDRNALIEFHVQIDGEFDRLVYDEQQDDEQGELRVRGWFAAHGMFRFLSKAAYGIRKYSNIFAEKHGTGRSAGRYAAAEPVFWRDGGTGTGDANRSGGCFFVPLFGVWAGSRMLKAETTCMSANRYRHTSGVFAVRCVCCRSST